MNYSWHLVPISGPFIDIIPHSFLDPGISCWWGSYSSLHHMPSVLSNGLGYFFLVSFHLAFHSAALRYVDKGDHFSC